MGKAKGSAPADKAALYSKLVSTFPQVEEKGATLPYTAVNGNMFSILRPDDVVCLRLPEQERTAFVAKFKTDPVVMYGAVMKEYVALPDALLSRTREAARYFATSFAYAESLKPKATKRPASRKSR